MREALPGEEQRIPRSTFYRGFVKFSSLTYIALNVLVNASVFDFWGNANFYMILISLIQLVCAFFTYTLSTTMSMETLQTLYNLSGIYVALVVCVSLPVALLSILAIYSFQESD